MGAARSGQSAPGANSAGPARRAAATGLARPPPRLGGLRGHVNRVSKKNSEQTRMENRDPKGYYAVLGVGVDADTAAIKAAYRRRAMELHPDRNASADATRQFQFLNEAYATLADPATRAEYDTASVETSDEPPAAAAREEPEPLSALAVGRSQPNPAMPFSWKQRASFSSRRARPSKGSSAAPAPRRRPSRPRRSPGYSAGGASPGGLSTRSRRSGRTCSVGSGQLWPTRAWRPTKHGSSPPRAARRWRARLPSTR